MRLSFALAMAIIFCLPSCRDHSGPDVSGIDIDLKVRRFEKDFFAIDTTNILEGLNNMYSQYPGFLRDYCQHILGLPPVTDTGVQVQLAIKSFLHDYRPVYDSVKILYPNMDKQRDEITASLKRVKFYFPAYKTPSTVITFIGPMDAYFEASSGGYGDVITTDALAVGLQLHLGSDFSMYTGQIGQELYPRYISRRFTPETISVNAIKNVIDDIFPDKSSGKTLVEQMVEKGKRMYAVDLLMPDIPDTLKIGYTGLQLKGCKTNEGLIWNYFLSNGLVFNNDPSLIKNYIGDSPNTPEFGEGAPGYIGLFVGWEIVKKYMSNHQDVSLSTLMESDSKKLFEESKYRPK